jgi:hypothetical protein
MSCTVLQGAFLPPVTILLQIEDLCSAEQWAPHLVFAMLSRRVKTSILNGMMLD